MTKTDDFNSIIKLKRNSDGLVVNIPYRWHYEQESLIFYWLEGNMGCDCNRYLEFERGLGNDPDVGSAQCSKGKYGLISIELKGEIVFEKSNHALIEDEKKYGGGE